jgi:hypothetical protein
MYEPTVLPLPWKDEHAPGDGLSLQRMSWLDNSPCVRVHTPKEADRL